MKERYFLVSRLIAFVLIQISMFLFQNSQSQVPSKIGSNTTLTPATTASNTNNTVLPGTAASATANTTTGSSVEASGNVLPLEAEIKIPAVGATPVAISTKLPAAVVQLTQQGKFTVFPIGYPDLSHCYEDFCVSVVFVSTKQNCIFRCFKSLCSSLYLCQIQIVKSMLKL